MNGNCTERLKIKLLLGFGRGRLPFISGATRRGPGDGAFLPASQRRDLQAYLLHPRFSARLLKFHCSLWPLGFLSVRPKDKSSDAFERTTKHGICSLLPRPCPTGVCSCSPAPEPTAQSNLHGRKLSRTGLQLCRLRSLRTGRLQAGDPRTLELGSVQL